MTLRETTLIGFDSAWADRKAAPGGICALAFDASGQSRFTPPRLVSFEAAADFVEAHHDAGRRTLVAIDQPTIVRNAGGMRPCERVVASVASWSGGGIQPSNREGVGKAAMFGDDAPIWRFFGRLAFIDDPKRALLAARGGYVLEVFPALALLDLDPCFATSGGGPRYNPARRKTFRQEDWSAVCDAVTKQADKLGFADVAEWCRVQDRIARPLKATQDRLDSVICLVVAALWLVAPERCAMIGDTSSGYIVAPVRAAVWERLAKAAKEHGLALARPA